MSTTVGPALHISLLSGDLGPRKKEASLLQMARRAQLSGVVREAEPLHSILLLRERLGGTAVGKGLAVPHARSLTVTEPHLLVARSRRGIDWAAPDDAPVHLVLLVLSPAETPATAHLELVARAAGALRHVRARQRLLEAADVREAEDVLREAWA